MPRKLVLDVARKPFSHHVGFSMGLSILMFSIRFPPKHLIWGRANAKAMLSFITQPWKDMLSLPYCIRHTDQSWYNVEDYTRSVHQERDPWETSEKLVMKSVKQGLQLSINLILSNSQVNSLWRKTLSAIFVENFQLKLNLTCQVHVINQYREILV